MFDIQVKRLHEYKRQLLNILSVVDIYFRLKEGRLPDFNPTVYLFGAKSAPGYARAKAIIRYINRIARMINNDSQVSFRLFDKNNYWSDPAMYDFGNSRTVVVDLHSMKDKNGNKISPEHIYIAGFWSLGGKPFVIESITLAQ
jgi:hypothetical protein